MSFSFELSGVEHHLSVLFAEPSIQTSFEIIESLSSFVQRHVLDSIIDSRSVASECDQIVDGSSGLGGSEVSVQEKLLTVFDSLLCEFALVLFLGLAFLLGNLLGRLLGQVRISLDAAQEEENVEGADWSLGSGDFHEESLEVSKMHVFTEAEFVGVELQVVGSPDSKIPVSFVEVLKPHCVYNMLVLS